MIEAGLFLLGLALGALAGYYARRRPAPLGGEVEELPEVTGPVVEVAEAWPRPAPSGSPTGLPPSRRPGRRR